MLLFVAIRLDDTWNVFEATEILPTYKDNLFLTIDDALQAAKTDPKGVTENCNDKVIHACFYRHFTLVCPNIAEKLFVAYVIFTR